MVRDEGERAEREKGGEDEDSTRTLDIDGVTGQTESSTASSTDQTNPRYRVHQQPVNQQWRFFSFLPPSFAPPGNLEGQPGPLPLS